MLDFGSVIAIGFQSPSGIVKLLVEFLHTFQFDALLARLIN